MQEMTQGATGATKGPLISHEEYAEPPLSGLGGGGALVRHKYRAPYLCRSLCLVTAVARLLGWAMKPPDGG
ncbi:hypothetical protein GCM10010387_18190 [Streptomyces inusitatus]|uniref:Uncharacterized protein n=1 Tax=Streptomyces inusitatus TaxID=68221 RepID=A0A918PYE2_9ACTN|nr:hypothetical protein GCM10010387_18190 [Streptomyces inusitatus]